MPDIFNLNHTEATLCFPIRGNKVLLAEKQTKLGAGLLNGFGGKVEPCDSDIYATNIREVREEIGISVTSVKPAGVIKFHNHSDDDELKMMIVHLFTATQWDGEPTETDEMKKIAWYDIGQLDYDKFLAADRLFLPLVLGGKCVRGIIEYDEGWSVKNSHIEEVEGF